MKARTLVLASLFATLAMPALAVVKVYNATAPGGTPGDAFAFSTTQCPPIQPTPGRVGGSFTLDDGGGTVTMTDLVMIDGVVVNRPDLTTVFGPGAFVFVNSVPTITTTAVPTASGSTAPTTGSVAWGVISSWKNTGLGFCIASPQTICTGGAMIPHGQTTALDPINSPTYDLGTWTFDAEGDLAATQNYIWRTSNGGTSNGQRLLRGAYVGSSIPALPLIGAGALALGLLTAGARSILSKK